MKKVISAGAVCALAVAAVVTPSALGVKSTKQVASSVTVNATPNPVVGGGGPRRPPPRPPPG